MGSFNGGTSYTTLVAETTGVPFNDGQVGGYNREDLDFQKLLHGKKPGEINKAKLEYLISERNKKHSDLWGVKYPALHTYPSIIKKFKNPHIIQVYRDPVAIARGEARRSYGAKLPEGAIHLRTLTLYGQMLKLRTMFPELPYLTVSFEYLLLPERRREEAERIYNFMGFDLDDDSYSRIEEAFNLPDTSYKTSREHNR